MSRHAQHSGRGGRGGGAGSDAEPTVPDAPAIAQTLEPVHRPGRPNGKAPPTVRVISAREGKQRKAEADLAVTSPDERRRAAQRFEQTRADYAEVRGRLAAASRVAADAQRRADLALAAYEEARTEARRATVTLRQRQRETADTKLAMRRALEWVARLEALDDQHPSVAPVQAPANGLGGGGRGVVVTGPGG